MKKHLAVLTVICGLFAAFMLLAGAENDKVAVTLPKFDITINGIKYNNKNTKYPIVVYNDITYLPIETDSSDHNLMSYLGFTCADNKSYAVYGRLFIKSIILPKSIPSKITMPKSNANHAKLTAVISPNKRIITNHYGKVREIKLSDYPILNVNGTEYLPMTYQIAREHLGLGYSFSPEKGLELTSATTNPKAVTVPDFDITLGGVKYRNEISEYPFLIYNDITYMPLTKGIADFMGITFTHTEETANDSESLDVSKAKKITDVPDFGYVQEGDSISLAIGETFDGELYINGKGTKWHTYAMEYPPFRVGKVWYLPLTWQIAHDYLGMEYSFDTANGLSLARR